MFRPMHMNKRRCHNLIRNIDRILRRGVKNHRTYNTLSRRCVTRITDIMPVLANRMTFKTFSANLTAHHLWRIKILKRSFAENTKITHSRTPQYNSIFGAKSQRDACPTGVAGIRAYGRIISPFCSTRRRTDAAEHAEILMRETSKPASFNFARTEDTRISSGELIGFSRSTITRLVIEKCFFREIISLSFRSIHLLIKPICIA